MGIPPHIQQRRLLKEAIHLIRNCKDVLSNLPDTILQVIHTAIKCRLVASGTITQDFLTNTIQQEHEEYDQQLLNILESFGNQLSLKQHQEQQETVTEVVSTAPTNVFHYDSKSHCWILPIAIYYH